MSSSDQQAPGDSIILEEEIDPNYEPTAEETEEYARWLGMDLDTDRDLIWIAREGLKVGSLAGPASTRAWCAHSVGLVLATVLVWGGRGWRGCVQPTWRAVIDSNRSPCVLHVHVAAFSLQAPLPENWKPCKTTDTEEIYYFNFKSGESTWDHPCDEVRRAERPNRLQPVLLDVGGGRLAC